jgi:hypothetical protein
MRDDDGDTRGGERDDYPLADDAPPAEAVREDGLAGRTASFDPTPYLRQLRGRGGSQDYLDVKWRLLWLRREHPDAEILTEHVQIDQTAAIFKATVTLPSGGKATGYGSETAGDFGDFIEKAETKAIGRALNALGYGAQFGERSGDEEPVVSPRSSSGAPVRTAPSPSVSDPISAPRTDDPSSSDIQPVPAIPPATQEAGAATSTPPIDIAAGRDRGGARAASPMAASVDAASEARPASTAGQDARTPAGDAGGDGTDPDLADYSWSAFWPWARGQGLNGPKAVEALISRPTAGLTPSELRQLIVQARGDGG